MLLSSAIIYGAGLLPFVAAAKGCNDDNCARAVTGTRRGDKFVTSAKADCSSFMQHTVSADPVTITVTGIPGTTPAPTKAVPTYATACSGTQRYSSACSCWSITGDTVTVTPTVTVTGSLPPGSTYVPDIPSSYDACLYDPAKSGDFELLDPNSALPIIKNGSLAKVIQEATDPYVPVEYKAVKPANAPAGVYDLQLDADGAPSFLAIYKSGKVGFVGTSSNGQTYVDQDGDKYITSAFSFTCQGRLTAGIIGGTEFFFSITDDQRVVVTTSAPAKTKRDIPVPKGFYVVPKTIPKPATGQRCFAGQTAVPNGVAPVANGCGAKGGIPVPNLSFEQCCNGHDICYGTCSQGFDDCNNNFLSCMRDTCAAFSGLKKLSCRGAANTYYGFVAEFGGGPYAAATKESCTCECNDKSLKACADKCVDTKNDPENCGDCNFHCPSGSCTNGACSFNSCTGSVCGAFGPCGPGGSCVCASITGGKGFCVNGQTPCASLSDCGTSADCPLGSVCAVGTCCQRNVCITTDSCGGFNSKVKRAWVNATIGEPANWIAKL